MSDVTLSIGGRNYTVSCADGQEDHVRHLASVIDGKLSAMGNNLSSNDAKNLLFAALLVEPWWTLSAICVGYLLLLPYSLLRYARFKRRG